MRRIPALLALGLAGCSLLYNPNNLPNPRSDGAAVGAGDAGNAGDVGDAAPVDADATKLMLTDIAPSTITEGQGDHGSLPGVFVIRGHNLVNNHLKVELVPPAGTDLAALALDPITDPVASADSDYLAFTLTSHVVAALASDVPLTVKVTQDGSAQFGGGTVSQDLPVPLTLHGLQELTVTSPGVNKTTKVIALPLPQDTYSQIDLVTGVPANTSWTFVESPSTGTAPAALTAVSSIALGTLVADSLGAAAGPGGFSSGATPGPGAGGAGGAAILVGGGGGGGGAGYADAGHGGTSGAGTGGSGGVPTGQDQILSIDANRSSAGGQAGGSLAVLGGTVAPGGVGGGGGGMIVLTAGGDISTGALSANGGPGASPGGGGGAGGTVVARTQAGAMTLGAIRVKNGAQGSATGGDGSVGRVRWDAPAGTAPSSQDRAAHRGPAFVSPVRVVTTASQTFMLTGTTGDELDVRVVDQSNTAHAGEHISVNTSGIATTTTTLYAGYNQVCVKLSGGVLTEPLANACVDVVFLP